MNEKRQEFLKSIHLAKKDLRRLNLAAGGAQREEQIDERIAILQKWYDDLFAPNNSTNT